MQLLSPSRFLKLDKEGKCPAKAFAARAHIELGHAGPCSCNSHADLSSSPEQP